MTKPNAEPTIFVIFGATGDLSQNKILPSLFDLYSKKFLPSYFRVIGFSRRELSREEFLDFARNAIKTRKSKISEKDLESFLENFDYQTGIFQNLGDFAKLGEHLLKYDEKLKRCSNKLFYLAVPPISYEIIFENLSRAGLTIPCSDSDGWTRVLVEKPFGKDLDTAERLEKKLASLFKEEQIFRIDHYLAKETVQNILSFRFSNVLFEPIWSKEYIEKIEIKFMETGGVGQRGEFYDDVGALRDVGQNHLLQMLAIVAMENPKIFNSENVRIEREKVLKSLPAIPFGQFSKKIIRGQYSGYKKEKGVASKSKTETYFRVEVEVNNDRWRGTPFFLESGKAAKSSLTEISIYFRETSTCLCPKENHLTHKNVLTFRVQPKEGIAVQFWAKAPGFNFELEPKNLSFSYGHIRQKNKIPAAYERVLFDCIRGDQTLFASTKEVRSTWEFITPIIQNWKKLPLKIYSRGSWGPKIRKKQKSNKIKK